MKSEDYCQEKAAPAGSRLYYSILFHHRLDKSKLTALFALHQELVDTVTQCQDADIARAKLQWWREEIQRLFDSQARHPVARALQGLMPALKLEHADLLGLVDAIAEEIIPAQTESMAQLINYFAGGRGKTWQLAALACDCRDVQAIEQVVTIGALSSCLDFFQLARQHLDRGCCPYPRLEMEKHNLNQQNLLHEDKLPAVAELQAELFTTIRSALVQCSIALREKNDPTVLFALTMANIAKTTCTILHKQSANIPTRPLFLTPFRKLMIAWRAKRQVPSNHRRMGKA